LKWDLETQRQFFDDIFKKKGLQSYKDWYTISKLDVVKNGGRGLLNRYYKGSHIKGIGDLLYIYHRRSYGGF
jgi:hypothetical protein